jgi:hypothetical protein
MWGRVAAALVTVGWLLAFASSATADEVVETTDGRKLRLRSDGIYEFLSRLDPAVMDRAVAVAKEWARDQTVIAGCFREATDRERLARNFPSDRDDALASLRRAGATEQQQRQVAEAIAGEYRAPTAADDAKPLPPACDTIQQDFFLLRGSGQLLQLREPFLGWK